MQILRCLVSKTYEAQASRYAPTWVYSGENKHKRKQTGSMLVPLIFRLAKLPLYIYTDHACDTDLKTYPVRVSWLLYLDCGCDLVWSNLPKNLGTTISRISFHASKTHQNVASLISNSSCFWTSCFFFEPAALGEKHWSEKVHLTGSCAAPLLMSFSTMAPLGWEMVAYRNQQAVPAAKFSTRLFLTKNDNSGHENKNKKLNGHQVPGSKDINVMYFWLFQIEKIHNCHHPWMLVEQLDHRHGTVTFTSQKVCHWIHLGRVARKKCCTGCDVSNSKFSLADVAPLIWGQLSKTKLLSNAKP